MLRSESPAFGERSSLLKRDGSYYNFPMSTFAALVVVASIFALFIQLCRKKFKSAGLYGVLALIAFTTCVSTYKPEAAQKEVAQAAAPVATDAPATDAPATDAPADTSDSSDSTPPPPTKVELLGDLDHSITPEKLAGNPQKYSQDVVRFNCTITNVLTGQNDDGTYEANAECGSGNTSDPSADGYHLPATIVLIGKSINQMDAGQAVRVLGVATSLQGKNSMGADTTFPAVQVDFAE
jgi:hypothetical protein